MINENYLLLNLQLTKKIPALTTFFKELEDALYALFCFILDDPIEFFWFECISMSLGYFQLLIFVLDETVSLITIKQFNFNV